MLTLTALALPAFLATTGLAVEGANWYQARQAMQNAADTAVIAAATNGTSAYAAEAKAVTEQYGFKDGTNNTSVTVSNSASCPSGGSTCYSVTIQRSVPLLLSSVIGFQGNATVGSSRAIQLAVVSTASQATTPRSYCVLALASSGTTPAIRTNGAPKADLTGCSMMSNTSMDCNGHNLKATYGDAVGTNSGCGYTQTSNMPAVSDPYSGRATNIPSDTTCGGSYPQAPGKKGTWNAANQITTTTVWANPMRFCGDVQLKDDVTLTAANQVIVIYNGQLDTNDKTLKTASGASVTIIFSGTNGSGANGTYIHAPTGGGTLDIAAPTSGNWSGVAIYQDPNLTSGVDISAAGNSPTWKITGLVYLPHASVTFSGAVNKSSNGASCFDLVVDNLLINGTGSILSTGQCGAAGLTMPQGNAKGRGQLVG